MPLRWRVVLVAVRPPAACPDDCSMDDNRSNLTAPDTLADSAVVPLRDKRRRLHALLATQREQIAELETALQRAFESLRQAACERAEAAGPAIDLAEFERQRTALAEEAQSLAGLSDELDRRQAELVEFEARLKCEEQAVVEQLQQQQAELDERAAELDATGAQLRQAQRALATAEEELAVDREHAAQLRERLQEQLHATEREREEASTRRSETNIQRRRIARELQHQRQTQKAEIASQHEAIQRERDALRQERERQHAELEQQRADVNRRREEARQLASANDERVQQQLAEHQHLALVRAEELESLREQHGQVLEEMAALRSEHDRQQEALAAHHQTDGRSKDELDRLRAELESLRARLTEAEARPTHAPAEADGRKLEDLKRRFELALEDLRELKKENAELEEQLADARAGIAPRDSGGSEKLDWETQKRRLLAELEANDTDDEDERETRLSIEGTIRITDEIVARKDREIAELKRVLEEQSSNLGSVAIGAAAIAEAFDQDELIRQERENLARVQQEWRDKLKQAEIDISVERARVARERLELDEKLQWLEAEKQKYASSDGKGGGKGEAGSPAQRRWWARLGLKETDENSH